jgi:SnoaL-like domain
VTNMSDEASIERQLILYCTLCDTKQFTAMGTDLFSPDAVGDYGLGTVSGGPDIAAHLSDLGDTIASTAHSVSNVVIDVDGDSALSSSYVLAWHWSQATAERGPTRPADYVAVGIYEDTWRRIESGWRITARVVHPLGPGAVAIGTLPDSLTGVAGTSSGT